jgi:hypothetical protein
MAEPTQTLVALDAAGRPHAVRVYTQHDGHSVRLSFDLPDGTPVEMLARGHYRTAGPPPHVHLFTPDADLADVPPAAGWSATATVAVTGRKRPADE